MCWPGCCASAGRPSRGDLPVVGVGGIAVARQSLFGPRSGPHRRRRRTALGRPRAPGTMMLAAGAIGVAAAGRCPRRAGRAARHGRGTRHRVAARAPGAVGSAAADGPDRHPGGAADARPGTSRRRRARRGRAQRRNPRPGATVPSCWSGWPSWPVPTTARRACPLLGRRDRRLAGIGCASGGAGVGAAAQRLAVDQAARASPSRR